MKGFAFILLCALVAVQGRHTGIGESTRTAAALGENPWLVHLRIAVSTSGLLNSSVGSLINSRWVLTTASSVTDARFIWVRYGAVNVIEPSLVTENSIVHIHEDYDPATGANDIALIDINRDVISTDNIAPVALANLDSEKPASASFCGFGADDSGNPGEQLNCFELSVEANEDGSISNDEVETTKYDIGAPLVSEGVQIGILTKAADEESGSTFTGIAGYLDWIQKVTGIDFNPEADPETAPEAVRFVN